MTRSPFEKTAFRVHVAAFLIASAFLVVIDAVQVEDGDAMLLGLHWAPMIVLPWLAVLIFHALLSTWDSFAADTAEARKRWWI